MCFHYDNNKYLLATLHKVKLTTSKNISGFKNYSSRTYLALVTKHYYLVLFVTATFGIRSVMINKY